MLVATFRLWQGRMLFTVTITIVLPGGAVGQRGWRFQSERIEANDDVEDALKVTVHGLDPHWFRRNTGDTSPALAVWHGIVFGHRP